jgi:hypothetical protein
MSSIFIVTGRNTSGIVSLRRDTSVGAIKKATELVDDGHTDVKITAPDGHVYGQAEFDQLNEAAST